MKPVRSRVTRKVVTVPSLDELNSWHLQAHVGRTMYHRWWEIMDWLTTHCGAGCYEHNGMLIVPHPYVRTTADQMSAENVKWFMASAWGYSVVKFVDAEDLAHFALCWLSQGQSK
jgi:hypothetical protein